MQMWNGNSLPLPSLACLCAFSFEWKGLTWEVTHFWWNTEYRFISRNSHLAEMFLCSVPDEKVDMGLKMAQNSSGWLLCEDTGTPLVTRLLFPVLHSNISCTRPVTRYTFLKTNQTIYKIVMFETTGIATCDISSYVLSGEAIVSCSPETDLTCQALLSAAICMSL